MRFLRKLGHNFVMIFKAVGIVVAGIAIPLSGAILFGGLTYQLGFSIGAAMGCSLVGIFVSTTIGVTAIEHFKW
jgi:hypothetical protein